MKVRYDMFPTPDKLMGFLPTMLLQGAYSTYVGQLLNVRDELARHSIAVGPSFVTGGMDVGENGTERLDRERRVDALRSAEKSIVGLLGLLEQMQNAILLAPGETEELGVFVGLLLRLREELPNEHGDNSARDDKDSNVDASTEAEVSPDETPEKGSEPA